MNLFEINLAKSLGGGSAPTPTLQTKSVTITENGDTTVTADEGYDALEEVDITVNVATGNPQLNAPTISVSSNAQGQSLIAISNPATNGNFVTKYKIFLDGNYHSETVQTSGIAITDAGNHSVTVKACGTNFDDSPASNAVTVNNYAITVTTTDCTAVVGNPTQVSNNGATATLYFTPNTGLEVRRASFTVTGATIVSASKISGSVTIGSATGAVSIAVVGLEPASAASITVDNLGSENPTNVTFTEEGEFDWDFGDVTDEHDNIFVQIPTIYRKINSIADGQITSFTISDKKIDNTYEPYPCFLDGNGNVLPYVLIGKYCCSSTSVANSVNANYASQSLATGRTNARALGTGYQLYDWQMQKLFVDLAMCHKKNVNFNSGQTIQNYLGIYHLQNNIWVDGFYHNNDIWYAALNPADYVSNPNSHPPTGYTAAGYACPTAQGQCVSKLGYDANNPFFNQPVECNGTQYTKWYCDQFYYGSGSHPVYSDVGSALAYYGLWYANALNSWTTSLGVRLCKKPFAA